MEIHWVNLDPERPRKYQENPHRWSVQVRVYDKKEKIKLQKEHGFIWNEVEDEDSGETLWWQSSLGKFAYAYNAETKSEDLTKLNKPVTCIMGDGTPVDPNTVGNGSIANLSITTREAKNGIKSRNLLGVQLVKYKKYTPQDQGDPFDLNIETAVEDEDETGDELPY